MDKDVIKTNSSIPPSGNIVIPDAKQWALYMLLMAIPVVNIIMLIVWALDKDPRNVVRSNFAKGYLIIMVIMIVLSILMIALFGGSLLLLGSGSGY